MSYTKAQEALTTLLSNMALQAQKERINNRITQADKEEKLEKLKLEVAITDLRNLKRTYNTKLENLNEKAQRNEDSALAFSSLPKQFKTSEGVSLTTDLNNLDTESLNSEIKLYEQKIAQVDSSRIAFLNNINNINTIKNTLESELKDFDSNMRITDSDVSQTFDSDKMEKLRKDMDKDNISDSGMIFDAIETSYKTDTSISNLNDAFIKANIGTTPAQLKQAIVTASNNQQIYFDDIFKMSFIAGSGVDGQLQLSPRLANAFTSFINKLDKNNTSIEQSTGLKLEEFQQRFINVFSSVTSDYESTLAMLKDEDGPAIAKFMRRIFEEEDQSINYKFKNIKNLNDSIDLINKKIDELSISKNVSNNLSNKTVSSTIDANTFFKNLPEG